jgi:hypothetical protein
MASEITETVSSVAGLVTRYQVDAPIDAAYTIKLYNAVVAVPTMETTAQWPGIPAPSAVSAHTEANVLDASTISIAAKTTSLASYAKSVIVSPQMLMNPLTAPNLYKTIVGDISLGVDKAICAQFADFTPAVSGAVCSPTLFQSAVVTTQNTGYNGTLVAIMSYKQFGELCSGILAGFSPATNDDIAQNGTSFKGRYYGAEIYTVPASILPTTGIYTYGLVYVKEYGLGFQYKEPIITFTRADYDGIAEILAGNCLADVTELTTTAGTQLRSTT